MRATRGSLCGLASLPCLLFLLCSVTGVVEMSSHRPTLKRSRWGHHSSQHKGAHHRPLTDEQKADQNLQFMLNLYRSAADPDGRPRQQRKFGSNTVRLLRPSSSSVHYRPTLRDHHYTFTVQYNLDTLPSEQLVRASFIHLRSSSSASSSSSPTSGTTQTLESARCRAQITSLGKESLVTLEPHEQWTETDITAHVSGHVLQGRNRGTVGHLTLTAHYQCTEPGSTVEASGLPKWWVPFGRNRRRDQPHLEVPSLLLYLEEDREVNDWMGELLRTEGENMVRQIGQWYPVVQRHRRSKDAPPSQDKDLSLDALKKVPTSSSSSFSTSPSASIIPDIPNYKRKTGVPKNRCKLHSFRLSFSDLGWGHYFIAPPVYNPRYCQGDCPRVLQYGYNSPNHAIIQTVINDLGIGDVPPPSCVPFKYMPMSVLVVHKKKVEYRELEDMVAESCTCR